MGALILTKGTRRLIKHFNTEFGSSQASGNIAFYRNNQAVFDRVGGTAPGGPTYLYGISQALPSLYPPDIPNHQNLIPRWNYFLTNVLSNTNHQIIVDSIFRALSNNNYENITFDAIEDTAGTGQTVLTGDENCDLNVSGAHKKTRRIILVTSALPNTVTYNGHNYNLDNQDQ